MEVFSAGAASSGPVTRVGNPETLEKYQLLVPEGVPAVVFGAGDDDGDLARRTEIAIVGTDLRFPGPPAYAGSPLDAPRSTGSLRDP